MQVSVVVLTYEPDINKLVATVESVIRQEKVEYELIISDDGSKKVDINEAEQKISSLIPEGIPFRFVKNEVNSGTVKNIFSACQYAAGEYIKLISPGDLLYDSKVLFDLYTYAAGMPEKAFFFGRAAYYSNNESLQTYDFSAPTCPWLYNSRKQSVHTLSVMFGQGPVGASYFHKTSVYKHYLDLIVNHVKFTEDYTTSILHLLDGGKLAFFDRKVVWYEYGLGISTNNAEKWKRIYEEDCAELYKIAEESHKGNKYLEFRFGNKKKRLLHPFMTAMVIRIRWTAKHFADRITNTEEQIANLRKILNNGVERKEEA